MDLTNHAVDVKLTDVVAGPSRVGIKTRGIVVSVREDSGFIMRCTECCGCSGRCVSNTVPTKARRMFACVSSLTTTA